MNYGAERAYIARTLAILVVLGAMGAIAALEPDGPVTFGATWSEPDPAVRKVELRELGAELRLDVLPGVALREAWLELRLPVGIAGQPLDPGPRAGVETEFERDGTTVLRFDLGSLGPGAARRLRFRLRLDGADGAVATFTIRGATDRGGAIRDAIGVVVGRPGVVPGSRHGALEFRAVPIPDPTESDP